MRESWLTPQWRGRRRIAHPVNWARLPEYDIGVAFVQARVDHGHENRWYLYVRKFNEADVKAFPVLASTVITSSPGSTQTITSDATWNNASNLIEVIGAGARGAHGATTTTSGGGGGGGAYTKIFNVSITTPGTDQYFARVGGVTATDGTAGGDSWWTLTSPGTSFPASGTAAGARGAPALGGVSAATGGLGAPSSGYASPSSGSAQNAGGAGGNGSGISGAGAGGGGGAAGFNGAGLSVAGTGPTNGGAGNNNSSGGGTGGTFGSPGGTGGAGTNIQTGPNVGSGGGGGGGNAAPSTGGAGGNYGGGGGGGGRSTGVGGQGAQGVIVLTWTPIFSGTLGATEATDTAAFPSGTVAWTANLLALEGTPYAMLLHFDGANASTTIVDSGGKNQVVTAHGAAQIDTSLLVFSNSALKLTTGGDYLDVGLHPDLVLGSSDFTVDFRARLSSGSTPQTFYEGGPANFKIYYDGANLKFTSAAGTITGGALASNTNYHIAVTRAAGSVRLFLDGAQVGSTLTDAAFYTTSFGYPQIGDGVAVVSGTLAATEANDTPAFTGTAAFPAVTGTLVTTEASDVAALTGTVAASYDSATNAWIAAVGAGNVDGTHAGYVDTFIRGLKTDGIFGKFDRIWIFAAQNTNSALVDLVALDVATATNSPTFTADRGFTGNGSSSYVDTTFNPSTQAVQFTLDDAHLAVWDNTNRAAATTVAVGTFDGSVEADLFPYQAVFSATGVGCRINLAAADPASIAYSSSLGLFIGQSISHTTQEMYVNGTSIGTFAKTYGGYLVNYPFFVCGENAGGGLGTPSTDQICMVSMGATLTSTQAANYYSRLRTYMTAVGVP